MGIERKLSLKLKRLKKFFFTTDNRNQLKKRIKREINLKTKIKIINKDSFNRNKLIIPHKRIKNNRKEQSIV